VIAAPRTAVRSIAFGLVGGALSLAAVDLAIERQAMWQIEATALFHYDAMDQVGYLLLVVLAGFLFGVALRPPVTSRYHPMRPIVASVMPVLLIAHGVAFLQGSLPGVLDDARFYMSPIVQMLLAFAVGVGVASGFESERESEASSDPTAPRTAVRDPVTRSRP
jgi:MFS family permease